MDFELFKNDDGTYTSPKNNRIYANLRAFRSHWFNKSKGGWNVVNAQPRVECEFCKEKHTINNIKRHLKSCWLRPENKRYCVVCTAPIKCKSGQVTCSYACSNKHFRTGEGNGNWNPDSYRSTCFLYHKKECVICGESNIVEVHHLDQNHLNNKPSNLIPLCPTHHQYWHSKFKFLVEDKIIHYIQKWIEETSSVDNKKSL